MASLMMKVVSAYLRIAKKPKMSTAARAHKAMNAPKTSSAPPRKVADRHAVTSARTGEFLSYTVQPHGVEPTRSVIYLHGGAYIGEISPQHWDLVSAMVDAGLRVEVPIYGLAPQYTYREAYAFVSAVYARVRGGSESMTVMGDSAGAGLALGLVQSLLERGEPTPDKLVLISPWLDLTLVNPEIPAIEKRDPWLSRAGLTEVGIAWAGGDDPTISALSPIRGALTGLPATDVYIGTHDVFHPDVMVLRGRAAAEGVDIRIFESRGAVHVYPLVPAPEGRRARAAIVASVASEKT